MKAEERQKIYDKYSGRCAYCGEVIKFKDMQVDHIIPKRNFKMHVGNKWKVPEFLNHLTIDDIEHIDNKMPACRVCNGWKAVHYLELFRTIQNGIT